MPKVVSPETGNEFSSDDVASGSTALFTLCLLLSRARIYLCVLSSDHDKVSAIQLLKMSESDGTLSSAESVSSQETSNSTESAESPDEMEVVGHVEPYAGEPLAHSSDEEEDTEEDQDGLSPAVLRARYEGEVTVNEW